MGGKKKFNKQSNTTENEASCKESDEMKRFVNLLPVYTIYKQKFRRLTKEEFKRILKNGPVGKVAVLDLCKEFMKAKMVPEDIEFSRNVGYLNLPRMMPLIALLAERAEYKFKPSLVKKVDFSRTNERFRTKFVYLLVYGFWYLGRVVSDSLSVKDQVNRGNMFNFTKGDLGYWWAGVRILDWVMYVEMELLPKHCIDFVTIDPRKYRYYTSRAIINMNQDPRYFLSTDDWENYLHTIKHISHRKSAYANPGLPGNTSPVLSLLELSDTSSLYSSLRSFNGSVSSLVSKESVD